MADTKISALTNASTLAASDEFAINNAGTSKKAAATVIRTWMLSGSATAASWPKFTQGTLLTTAEAGALEMDTSCFYATTDAGNRGVVAARHIIRADTTRNLSNSTSAQAVFATPASGQITLEVGAYLFEGMYQFTAMSATSGNAAILFGGGGTFGTWLWWATAIDAATPATPATFQTSVNITNTTATAVATAGTATVLAVFFRGTMECTVAGTFIPQITLLTGAVTPAVAAGSFCMLERIGSTSMTSVGQWT